MISPLDSVRKSLRTQLRARRKAVPPLERAHAGHLVARHADRAHLLRAGRRIAIYASLREELDTRPLIELAQRRGCRVFLPCIERRTGHLHFHETLPGSRESVNHLGITEPEGTARVGARWLDIVFMPLVGFDHRGMRLGMGGGYYDRTFAWRNVREVWGGPRLIGLAYAFQQLPLIEGAAHDVHLDAVITEKGIVRCRTGS